MSMLKKNNPWVDIASYSTAQSPLFKGRRSDINRFMDILNVGCMSVLYANSGIGKTSFINAGISPSLIEQGYFPIHILFPDYVFEKGFNIKQWIWNLFWEEICYEGADDDRRQQRTWQFTFEEEKSQALEKGIPEPFGSCEMNLWWLLHAYQLIDLSSGKALKPFIIFDQFEEVFVKSLKAKDVLIEIFNIIESISASSFPGDVRNVLKTLAVQDIFLDLKTINTYKVVFSLRKEFLSDFDYWTNEKHSIAELLNNRMLLPPMTRKQAEEVISQQPLLDTDGNIIAGYTTTTLCPVKEEIIDFIDNRKRDEVEPFLLSVICSRLFQSAPANGTAELSKENLRKLDIETIISDFYLSLVDICIKNKILAGQDDVSRLENILVSSFDGHRIRVSVRDNKEFRMFIHGRAEILKKLEDIHLLRRTMLGDDEFVEIIHDHIAASIYKRIIERQVRRKRFLWGTSFFVLFLILFLGHLLYLQIRPKVESLDGVIEGRSLTHDVIYSIPGGVLRLKNDSVFNGAFIGNTELKTIIIGDSTYIGREAFALCENLESIHLDGQGITVDSSSFEGYGSVRVHISDSCTLNVHSFSGNVFNFEGISSFVDRNPYFSATLSELKYTNDTFTISLSESNEKCLVVESVDSMSFEYGQEVILSDTTSTRVSRFSNDENSHIVSLNLNKIKTVPDSLCAITNNYGRVKSNSSIREIRLNSAEIVGNSAFEECNNLKWILLPKAKVIGNHAFAGCCNLTGVELPCAQRIGKESFSGDRKLCHLDAPLVEDIGERAFIDCDSLRRLSLPLVKTIGREAFSGCGNLNTIDISNADSIGKYAFTKTSLDTIFTSAEMASHILYNPGVYGLYGTYEFSSGGGKTFLARFHEKVNLGDSCYFLPGGELQYIFASSLQMPRNIAQDTINSIAGSLLNFNSLQDLELGIGHYQSFSWNNAIYRGEGCLLYAANANTIAIMSPVYIYDKTYSLQGRYVLGEKCERLIHFAPNEIISVKIGNPNGAELVVPYGYLNACRNLYTLKDFKKISELGLFETLYYKLCFYAKSDLNAIVSQIINRQSFFVGFLLLLVYLGYLLFAYIKMGIGKSMSLLYVLFWLSCYIPLLVIYSFIRNGYEYNYFNYAIPGLIACALGASHVLLIAYKRLKFTVNLQRMVFFLFILSSCGLIMLIQDNRLFMLSLVYMLTAPFIMESFFVFIRKCQWANKEECIIIFREGDVHFAKEIRQYLLANGIHESNIIIIDPDREITEVLDVCMKANHCYFVLSREAFEDHRVKVMAEKIILKIVNIFTGSQSYLVPIVYNADNLRQLSISRKMFLAIWTEGLYQNKPIIYKTLTKDSFANVFKTLVNKRYSLRGLAISILYWLVCYIVFLMVVMIILHFVVAL